MTIPVVIARNAVTKQSRGARIRTEERGMQKVRLLAAACLVCASFAHAGGEMGETKHKDEGIRFFGFVRDANGKPVPEAKVVAEIKNSTRYVTHTSKNGMYSFGGFTRSVKPDDVTISC